MKTYSMYTQEEEKTIKKYAGVKKIDDIAAILGRTKVSIASKAARMKLSLRTSIGEDHHWAKLSNLQVEMINALTVSGFGVKEIHAAAFSHVDYSTINRITLAYNRKVK
jgi:hypothetical protein